MNSFATRLKAIREEKGLTQQSLASAAGLSLGAIRNYEQGVRGPTWEAVLAICKALGVSCTAFSDEKGADRPHP